MAQIAAELKLCEYNLGRKNIFKKRLERARENETALKYRKESLLINSAEYHAESYKYYWNIHKMVYDVDGKPLWKTESDFLYADKDEVFEIINEYSKNFILGEGEVRELARSGTWRVIFDNTENALQIFDRPAADLDYNQINLLHWTNVYKNVMECAEPPSDDIIKNDDLFDEWLKDYSEKMKRERIKNSLSVTKNKKSDLSENFIVTDEAGADKLYADLGTPDKFKKKG